ncbi:hypothetical protein JF66_19385 [Cryobacterium sp. MLB-32]|uniref:hypothetical protein n=1 Tax=Cryobacterium sp. MLB-32 TaxID=1529318 RepID=UPI0004E638C6|nr:hypothetical protein [Cryobacterium sp. MLB-32]KFF58327.1 hypothetical protein JF66_19385 [Cryobacterium sp. MLB-32]
MAEADPTDHEKDPKLLALEKVQWWIQVGMVVLSAPLVFMFSFPALALVDCLVIFGLFFLMLFLDRRIRSLGGRGGLQFGDKP